jgi:hypothetical protein
MIEGRSIPCGGKGVVPLHELEASLVLLRLRLAELQRQQQRRLQRLRQSRLLRLLREARWRRFCLALMLNISTLARLLDGSMIIFI